MSLSGPILWPPARENWKVGTVKVSRLLPPTLKEKPHLHPACVPYHLLYTEGKLLIPLPQLAMNRREPPAKNNNNKKDKTNQDHVVHAWGRGCHPLPTLILLLM